MKDSNWAFRIPVGLFAAHVVVAALSVKTGPFPLTSHAIQLVLGILAAVTAVRAAKRSEGIAKEFWWLAATGYSLWCLGQTLDSYYGLILKVPFEQRWWVDVFYYAWPASLVIGLSLSSTDEDRQWVWERILDFVQAGIVLLLLYTYFADVPLHARSPGIWKLSLATDGLIAAAFFARAELANGDPTRKLFRRIGYFRLVAALTDLYFVAGLSDSVRSNWFDPVWSSHWLFAIYAAVAWEGNAHRAKETRRIPRVQPAQAGQFLLATFPLLVVILAAEVAKGQLVLASIAIVFSLSISFGRLTLSRRLERKNVEARNRAIEKLVESEERYRTLFEGSPVGIAVLDASGKEVACNDAFRSLVGVPADERVNLDLLMSLTSPDRRKTDRAIFEEISSGKKNLVRREKQYQRRDGKSAWTDLTLFSQQGPSGKTTLITEMAIDISDKKHLEQQLRQSQKMETIGRLAGGVAHDFNNLLTVIRGYSEIMMDDRAGDTSLVTRLGHIKRAADRAASLTYQLLAFSRQQILQPRVFQLDELVLESTKMLQRLIGEDIEMKIVGTTNLGKIKADPGQIEQVILNLAVNARDAMPNGGTLTIETANAELTEEFCSQHAGSEPGRYVMLGLSDTGVGMDEETLLHIFEPFYTTKEVGKGTGLGLSMVYGIVKQSGGYILVESKAGEGTTFQVYLPRVDEENSRAEEESGAGKTKTGHENILLVEDDEAVRELAREVLTARGYAVVAASGPKQAMELCARTENRVDLLITDAVMPEMSGREMAAKLSKIRPGMKILLMSGYTQPQVGSTQLGNGGMEFLQKPFTPGTLAQAVRQILDQEKK